MINVSWSEFKSFVNSRSLSIQYVELSIRYCLIGIDGGFSLSCELPKNGGSDVTDFETNYKPKGNRSPSAQVTTQYEVNNKDLKMARMMATVDPDTGKATASLKCPGTAGSSDGRYIAGGYGLTEDFNKDDYALCWVEDDDRIIAWGIALAMDPSATAPVADAVIQGMGIVPGLGISMPSYPVVKTYHDDWTDPSNTGWYMWPVALGDGIVPMGEIEIETISGYGFLPSGIYLKVQLVRPTGVTTGGIRIDLFWGRLE